MAEFGVTLAACPPAARTTNSSESQRQSPTDSSPAAESVELETIACIGARELCGSSYISQSKYSTFKFNNNLNGPGRHKVAVFFRIQLLRSLVKIGRLRARVDVFMHALGLTVFASL